jgi:hypothetical protein
MLDHVGTTVVPTDQLVDLPPEARVTATRPTVAGVAWRRGRNIERRRARTPIDRDRRLIRYSSLSGLGIGSIVTLLCLWNAGLDPFRSARVEGFGSNFYDIQARALFHGHFDVPYRILGIESFNVDGRTYMYFPPWPAVLRMPVLLLTDRFDGRLTAPSMLLGWSLLAFATVSLVWLVRRIVRGDVPVSRTDAIACTIFIAAVTGGTVLLYIVSLPWVYHEVYLWSAAWAVAALACFARLALPAWRRRHILLLAGCVLGIVLTRTTAGWPMALATIATGAWMARRTVDRRWRAGILIIAAGLAPLAVSALINWIKFRHPYMIPLEHQEWTQQSARRRLALRMNDGSLAGTQFFPTTLVNYFRPDGIRFVPHFPFVTMPAKPARIYADAFIDQRYRTGSVTAFMPLLVVLALVGFATTFRRRAGRALTSIRIPLLGALGITITVMCYGYLGFRYTSEFVAVLTAAGAVGLAELTRRVERWRRPAKRRLLVAIAAMASFSIYANAAVAVSTARTTGRGSGLEQLVSWQDRISSLSGNPLAARTHLVAALPESAAPDELYIVGDCDALYLSTGELYEPWVAVQVRDMAVTVEAAADGTRPEVLGVFVIDGIRPLEITIETTASDRVRLRVGEGIYVMPTDWQTLPPGGRIVLRLRADTARDAIEVEFGSWTGDLPLAEWGADWYMVVSRITPDVASIATQLRAGVGLSYEPGPVPGLCNRLRDRATD